MSDIENVRERIIKGLKFFRNCAGRNVSYNSNLVEQYMPQFLDLLESFFDAKSAEFVQPRDTRQKEVYSMKEIQTAAQQRLIKQGKVETAEELAEVMGSHVE